MKTRRILLDAKRELNTVAEIHQDLSRLRAEYPGMRAVLRTDDGVEWTVMTKIERADGCPAVLVLTGKRTTVED